MRSVCVNVNALPLAWDHRRRAAPDAVEHREGLERLDLAGDSRRGVGLLCDGAGDGHEQAGAGQEQGNPAHG